MHRRAADETGRARTGLARLFIGTVRRSARNRRLSRGVRTSLICHARKRRVKTSDHEAILKGHPDEDSERRSPTVGTSNWGDEAQRP
jgi:hypothetical protein